MYLLAIIFPPLAVLMCKKPFQCLINLFLCLFFWVPGMIHALLVVKDKKAEEQIMKQTQAIKNAIQKY